MYYEINGALNNRHLFATHRRSITSEHTLRGIIPIMDEKFPEREGYSLFVSPWEYVKAAAAKEKNCCIFKPQAGS